MQRQVPHGPENLICPLHKKAMEAVCHKCPWWVQIRGKNPQSNEEADHWNCAIAWGPMLAIEVSQQVRQGAAATESFRNEVVARADASRAVAHTPPAAMIARE